MSVLTLDAGALIAIERADRAIRMMLAAAEKSQALIYVPAGALAQAWRGGGRQARLAHLLQDPRTRVVEINAVLARAAGELCGRRGMSDVIDATVALTAHRVGGTLVTSDPVDLSRLIPGLPIAAI